MAKAGNNEAFNVVGDAIVAALDKGKCLCRSEQCERAARADAQLKRIRVPCRLDDLQQVIEQRLGKSDGVDQFLQFENVAA